MHTQQIPYCNTMVIHHQSPHYTALCFCTASVAQHGLEQSQISDHIDYTISRYRSRIRQAYDIVAAVYRTISSVHERMSRACAAHILQRLHLIDVARRAHRPWLPLPHVPCGRPIMQRIGSLGRGRQLHQWWAKLCVQKGPLCSSYRVESKS